MIALDVKQGSEEWFAARMGLPSASRFADIVTSKGAPAKGATRQTYLCELAAERLTGVVQQHWVSDAMERGTKLEPRARAWYEMERGVDVRQFGFIYGDATRRWGASPDGIVGDPPKYERGIEIKCPLRAKMIGMLLDNDPPAEYALQIQGGMWCAGLPAWDLVLYTEDAGVPNRIWTIEADPALHAAFAEIVPAFCDDVEAAVKRLRELRGNGDAAPVDGMKGNGMP